MGKKFVWLVLSGLTVAALLVTSCAQVVEDKKPAEVAPTPPKVGEWVAPADFGELRFSINSTSDGITKT